MLGVGDAGMKNIIFEMMTAMNFHHGPWASSTFYRQSQESLDHFLSGGNSSDTLFQALYEDISRDLGKDRFLPHPPGSLPCVSGIPSMFGIVASIRTACEQGRRSAR